MPADCEIKCHKTINCRSGLATENARLNGAQPAQQYQKLRESPDLKWNSIEPCSKQERNKINSETPIDLSIRNQSLPVSQVKPEDSQSNSGVSQYLKINLVQF